MEQQQQQQQQWASFGDAPPSARHYAASGLAAPQHAQREPTIPAIKDVFSSPAAPSRAGSMALPSPAGAHLRAAAYGDSDVPMEDADAYGKPRYTSRANHQHRHSQQYLQQDESAAARRYSPMNLSPTSPYHPGTQSAQTSYVGFSPPTHSNRQSPTRNNSYMSPPAAYYSPPGASLGSLLLHADMRSHATACASAPAHPVQHQPRQLLSAVRHGAAQCHVQSRQPLATLHHRYQLDPAPSHPARVGAQVCQMRQHGRSRAQNQRSAPLPPRSSRRRIHQRTSLPTCGRLTHPSSRSRP